MSGFVLDHGYIRVSSGSNPRKVASVAFRMMIDDGADVEMRALGDAAVGRAAKAVALADGMMEDAGRSLSTRITFCPAEGDFSAKVSLLSFVLMPA